MSCCAALSTAVTAGLMLSGCVSSSERELWMNAPIFVGPAIIAAWKMVSPRLGRGLVCAIAAESLEKGEDSNNSEERSLKIEPYAYPRASVRPSFFVPPPARSPACRLPLLPFRPTTVSSFPPSSPLSLLSLLSLACPAHRSLAPSPTHTSSPSSS
jgi:hypothetical protein